MSTLNAIEQQADQLWKSLDEASWEENKFNLDLCIEFEKMSWQVLRLKNSISNIKENM